MTLKRLLLGILILLVAGCGQPTTYTQAPAPEVISVIYPGSLQPWADTLRDCSAQFPQASLYFFQQSNPDASDTGNRITLSFGQPSDASSTQNLYQVGWEQVVVVVNAENSLEELSAESLRQIFSGEIVNWTNDSNRSIQVWVLPESEPTRQLFDQALAGNFPLPPEAQLAPDPAAVLKEVANGKDAIGYLPQSFLINPASPEVSSIRIVQLDQSMEQALHQPVIAIVNGEPTGVERNLLLCLQNTRK